MINLNDFAKEVHENAVSHGFWEGERSDAEIIALIHSEWSEALEEYRAGHPMVWYACQESIDGGVDDIVCNPNDEYECTNYQTRETCKYRSAKPEGVAVELIDGCIRILDCLAERGHFPRAFDTIDKLTPAALNADKAPLPTLVALLHKATSEEYDDDGEVILSEGYLAATTIGTIGSWLRARGIDPEAIMMEKHNYNKGRPYKHGKVC